MRKLISTAFSLLFSVGVMLAYNVTFRVDMSNVTGFTTPEVNGTFNGWCGSACSPMTDANGDGIWEVTVDIPTGTYEFKFAADNWTIQESLIAGSACTVTNSGFTNRTLTVGTSDITMPIVCWGTCAACTTLYPVTFKVDVSTVSQAYTQIQLGGSFNNWTPASNPMTDGDGDEIYETTINLAPGTYEYKFAADSWNISENLLSGTSCTSTSFGFTNRVITVTNAGQVLDAVCWGSCTACNVTPPTYNVTFRVDMSNVTGFTTPTVNGTFNGWSGTANPLTDANNDGIWETTIPLQAATYEYKFAYDNWTGSENLTQGSSCTVTNNGFTNRALTVSGASTLDVVCYGSCLSCSAPSYNVTFRVDMSQQTGFTTPTVNGNFNSWSGNANPLTDANGDGIWETTLSLQAGVYEYKFAYDNWAGQENFTPGGTCTVTNNGFTNRALTVSGSTTLDVVCFNSCLACTAPSYNVTFKVDMSNVTGFTTPTVNGTFNGWNGTANPMTDANGDGIWETTIALQAGVYEYKFAYDDWAGQENFIPGGACTVTNNGFTNRALTVSGAATLGVVCFNSCLACTAPTYNITFKVDMSNVTGFTTPTVNGSFNGWNGTANPMTDANGDGIWECTIALQAGTYEYKFAYDDWAGQETLTPGSSCTISNFGFTNRLLTVSDAAVLNVVCWGSCLSCSAPSFNVTFRVDMSQQSGFTTPTVNGTFNSWSGNANPMTDVDLDGIWETTIALQAGTYEYKFAYDDWAGSENLTAGSSCTITTNGFTNRALTVTGATSLPTVCWNSCTNCSSAPPTYNVTFKVDMSQQSGFTTPTVNGSFNGWSGTANPLTDANGDGVWETTIPLPAGNYEFKFAYDNWTASESLVAGTSCTVTNSGFTNRSLVVTNANIEMPIVCWGSCGNCAAPTFNVTFQVDMSQQTGFTIPEVNGTFNGWCGNCNALSDANGDNIWEVTLPLPAGNYEFKYSADFWTTQESLTPGTSCTVTNGGFTNRTLVVSNANIVMPLVCWNSCSTCCLNLSYYVDSDGDGAGTGAVQTLCTTPTSGYALTAGDCNDNNASINPTATEICGNTIDENCDGIAATCGDDFSNAVTVTNISQFGFGVQSSISVDLVNASNSVESPGTGNDRWYSFMATGNAVRISLTGGSAADDNEISLYGAGSAGGSELSPLTVENAVSPSNLGTLVPAPDGGSEILYYANLVPNQNYLVCIRNVNSTPGVCTMSIGFLRASQADILPFTANTGVYNSTCANFKAAFRSQAAGYVVNRWSSEADANAAVANLGTATPTWSYAIPPQSNGTGYTMCQLGKILPANLSGALVNHYVTVDVVYNLKDAAGNSNTLTAYGNTVSMVGLNSESALGVRSTDLCTAGFKRTTSFISTNRSVCGTSRYNWKFTEAFPTAGLPSYLVGAAGASRLVGLSSVPGMALGKRYDVWVRAQHIDGISYTTGTTAGNVLSINTWFPTTSASASCVKTLGAAGMVLEEGASVEPIEIAMDGATFNVFPNPTNGNFINVFTAQTEGFITVNVLDASGRSVHTEKWNLTESNTRVVEFANTLSNGIYQLQLTQGSEWKSIKFIVAR